MYLVDFDRTKMRSKNRLSNIYKCNEIDKVLQKVDEKIEEYMSDLDSNDKSKYDFLNKNIPKKMKPYSI